jgi:hypothetical protein
VQNNGNFGDVIGGGISSRGFYVYNGIHA